MIKYIALFSALLLNQTAAAHSYSQQSIQIGHAWGLPTTNGETQAYFPLLNAGKSADMLLAMTTPAGAAVFVDSAGNAQSQLALAAGKPMGMRKGGAHVRLSGLKKPLKHGDKLPLTLTFARAGRITIEVWIEPAPYAKLAKP
jgi:periplasmic copper chaperone A